MHIISKTYDLDWKRRFFLQVSQAEVYNGKRGSENATCHPIIFHLQQQTQIRKKIRLAGIVKLSYIARFLKSSELGSKSKIVHSIYLAALSQSSYIAIEQDIFKFSSMDPFGILVPNLKRSCTIAILDDWHNVAAR